MTDAQDHQSTPYEIPDSEKTPRKMAREIDVERWKRKMRSVKRSGWSLDPWTSCFVSLCAGAIFALLSLDSLSDSNTLFLTAAAIGFGLASIASFFRHRGDASFTNRTVEEVCTDIDEVVRVTNEEAETSS